MQNYKDLAFQLAEKAGKIMLANFKIGVDTEIKKDFSPVTKADLEINSLVIKEINKNFPDHSIIAEEESAVKESKYTWVCDPIDGTIPFSHGIPTAVFALALMKNYQPILSVIADPFSKRIFSAEKGKGAFLNNKSIKVNNINSFKAPSLGTSTLGAWIKYDGKDISKHILKLTKKGAKVITLGSIIYSGALVASGEFCATIFPGKKIHDTVALTLLVEEAGGKATDITGKKLDFSKSLNGHIISNGALHNKILDTIK